MKKFVLYARSSKTSKLDTNIDFIKQMEHMRKYAIKFEEGEILKEFTEVSTNKTLNDRPELKSAIALAQEQEAILMVDHVHIVAIMMKDLLEVLDSIEDRFYCCNDLDSNDEPID